MQAPGSGRSGSRLRGAPRTMLPPAEGARFVSTRRTSKPCCPRLRVFVPPDGFRDGAVANDPAVYDTANADFERSGPPRLSASTLGPALGHGDGLEPTVGDVVRGGTLNASLNCLDRHVEAGGGDKVAYHWEGEPGDTRTITYRDLSRRSPARERPEGPGRAQGRPREHLPRHGARAADRDAGVRAHRRAALRGVRRLQRRVAPRSDQRRRGQGAHHRRRGVAPRQHRPVEGQRRRGGGGVPEHRARRHGAPHAAASIASQKGRDIWYHELRRGAARPSARPSRWMPRTCSTSSTRRGTTGKPKGIVHTTGGYLTRVAGDAPVRLRHPRRRRVLVRGRHRLGHRPHATSSTGRWPTTRPA